MSVLTVVDIHEDEWFAAKLLDEPNGFDCDHKPLSEGDFRLIPSDGSIIAIERKTWADAMSSWRSKRLIDQVSRMVEHCDKPMLIIEGSKDLIYGASKSDVASLQAHLNRLAGEVLPVLYTSDRDSTVRQVVAIRRRVAEGEFGTLIRPITVVTTTRNKHSSFLERIPKIGRTTAEKIMGAYDSVADLLTHWEDQGRAPMKVKSKTWQGLGEFLMKPWNAVSSEDEREVIVSIDEAGNKGTTQQRLPSN